MKIKKSILKKYTFLGIMMMAIVYILSLPTMVYGASNNSTSENVTTNVTIVNSAPFITQITIADIADAGIMDLSPNTSVKIYCNGTAFDKDGTADLTTSPGLINATLFDSTSKSELVANFSTHYKNSSCEISTISGAGSATNVTYACSFMVFFNANPDTWTCNATAVDKSGLVNFSRTKIDTETMGVLMAIDISDSIDFGDLKVGADTGSADTTSIVYNEGNTIFDINLQGYANSTNRTTTPLPTVNNLSMYCATGKINDSHLRYSLSASTAWSSKKIIWSNTTGYDDTAFNLERNNTAEDQSVNPLPSYKNIYWGFGIPLNPIVAGECSGFVEFTAIS